MKRFFFVPEWNMEIITREESGSLSARTNIIFSNFRSSHVVVLLLRLDSNKTKIAQVYVPTSENDDDEVEKFYHDLESSFTINSTYTVVMGDFNAKLGRGRKPGEKLIGKLGSAPPGDMKNILRHPCRVRNTSKDRVQCHLEEW